MKHFPYSLVNERQVCISKELTEWLVNTAKVTLEELKFKYTEIEPASVVLGKVAFQQMLILAAMELNPQRLHGDESTRFDFEKLKETLVELNMQLPAHFQVNIHNCF